MMNESFYKAMEKRFGPARPESREWSYWSVENIGFSDPRRPSWFECNDSHFTSEDEALEFAKKWSARNKIECRVVKNFVQEEYTYVKPLTSQE